MIFFEGCLGCGHEVHLNRCTVEIVNQYGEMGCNCYVQQDSPYLTTITHVMHMKAYEIEESP